MHSLVKWITGRGAWFFLVILLTAYCAAEYGNYQRGQELQQICDLLGPHDRDEDAEVSKQEIDEICRNVAPSASPDLP